MTDDSCIGVIPARWSSSRFPGKVLASIRGKPMIRHVWERARGSRYLKEVHIACDDPRVEKEAAAFGAPTVMTPADLASGTDRIAFAFGGTAAGIIVNIQADEPLIEPEVIDALIEALRADPGAPMATAVHPLSDPEARSDSNVVKAVLDARGRVLYFSRAPIPWDRDGTGAFAGVCYKHLGIYAYRRTFLEDWRTLPASGLERCEKLEQLRVLEAGFAVRAVVTEHDAFGVDTREDLEKVRDLLEAGRGGGRS